MRMRTAPNNISRFPHHPHTTVLTDHAIVNLPRPASSAAIASRIASALPPRTSTFFGCLPVSAFLSLLKLSLIHI